MNQNSSDAVTNAVINIFYSYGEIKAMYSFILDKLHYLPSMGYVNIIS